MPELEGWESYYLIVGGAAGALIGLQFVVLTLIAERPSRQLAEAGGAFATPQIIHFAAALFLAALLRMPWRSITIPAVLWGAVGVAGVVYAIIVALRMRRQSAYRPQLEDWLFHVLLPETAYAALVAAASVALLAERDALFTVGGAALALLLIGIHNAWDAVFYHVVASGGGEKE